MNYEISDSSDVVTLKVQTYSLKTVNVKFSKYEIKIEVEFKNRLPEKETFEFHLGSSIDAEASKYGFEGNQINCELVKIESKSWTKSQIKLIENLNKKTKKRIRNNSDWDRLIREQEKDDQDNKNPDDVFQELYACSDDNAKRAMLKSFTESNGTVLSMNWNEVGKDRVKPFQS